MVKTFKNRLKYHHTIFYPKMFRYCSALPGVGTALSANNHLEGPTSSVTNDLTK
jgi:hypothetical protein